MYGLNILRKHGFKPFITPDVAKEEILYGIGFNPRGEESNVYSLEGEGSCLVATAEITLGGYHSDEIIKKESLPLKYCGLSHCFRREAEPPDSFQKGFTGFISFQNSKCLFIVHLKNRMPFMKSSA